ncbi:MAG: ribonuclease H-like domain-containing protein [Candidatus Eisenbacteria bacterium]
MSVLAETLARLAERRVRGGVFGAAAPELAPGPVARPPLKRAGPEPGIERDEVGVESYLPGCVLENAYGRCYLHERLRSDIERRETGWGRFRVKPARRAFLHAELEPLVERGLEGCVFVDLETGGFGSSPVFLAGTMHWNGSDYVVRQYFARDYAEEAALVDELTRFLATFDTVISYNGKSYDVPFLGDRAALHHVAFTRPPRHLDLLHHARRRWKGVYRDCRLVTLELYVCKRRRSGDVPSDEVPGLYHDFVKYGGAHRLVPVFHHNLLDVITMDELLRELVQDPLPPEGRAFDED